jgi:hypothetical protein
MTETLAALGPVFGLILVGFVLRRLGFPSPAFWPAAEKVTYFILFPALLFHSLATAQLGVPELGPMVSALVLGLLATAGLALALRPRLGLTGPAFTSLFQGAIRPNTYVGIAIAFSAWGAEGVALTAVAIGVVVPLVNVLAVVALVGLGSGARRGMVGLLGAILANPLILACAAGAAVNLHGLALPETARDILDLAGKIALLLGLMSVGAALEPGRLRPAIMPLAWTCGLKLVASPVFTALAAVALGVGGLAFPVAILYAALPVSASSYVLASRMGGDRVLMAGAMTATTVVAMVTLPAVLILAR